MGTSFVIGKSETSKLGVSMETSFVIGKSETPKLGVSTSKYKILVLSSWFHKLRSSRLLETLMTEKFRNKYRVQTTRLNGYDYTRNGAYFITICTKQKIPCFGIINDCKMILSETGIIICDHWLEIQYHFPNIHIDEFIIMPDHLHGIIIIKSKSDCLSVETPNSGVSMETSFQIGKSETPELGVSMETSFQIGKSETPELGVSTNGKSGNPYWKSNSIGSIINQFKRICTIKTKSMGLDLSWQPRFYDHIIRSDNELDRIRTYIKNNPNNWLNDEHYIGSNNM